MLSLRINKTNEAKARLNEAKGKVAVKVSEDKDSVVVRAKVSAVVAKANVVVKDNVAVVKVRGCVRQECRSLSPKASCLIPMHTCLMARPSKSVT